MDLKGLIKKWEDVLGEGTEIKNPKVMKSTALMLENEYNYLHEAGGYTEQMFNKSGGYATSGEFHKIAIPMVRRTFPELIAHEIVGVQPLTGPVGLAFALRFRAGATYSGQPAGQELGFNTIDKTYTGSVVTTAGEALGSKAGSGVGGDIGIGVGAGTHIKEVNMTVEKAQVEANTRKLRSRWSLEVAQDLKAMHGLDLEEEMMDILAYEITAEIDRELVDTINGVANTSTWSYRTNADGRWEAEKYRNLYNEIVRRANKIAVLTRRGPANFIVCAPSVCAALEAMSSFTIAPVNADVNTQMTGVARLGSLDGRMTVYRDTFATETVGASGTSSDATLGYKGPSEYDTGIIYLPYIQLLVSKSTFEDSFNPAVGLMSRYAIHSHIFGAANYYHKITVQHMP